MEIGRRIKQKREELGWSQEELANKVGYKSRSSINKIETDGRGLPQSKIVAFAKALNTTPAFLMGWDETPKALLNDSPIHAISIPVLGRVAAGIPITATEYIIDTEEISQEMANGGEYFALQIKGDSMEPKISTGDVVIVRKQEDADDGDLVIALINGDDAVCKRLKKYAEGLALISTNPAYEPLYFTQDEVINKPVQIIGKVKELRAKF